MKPLLLLLATITLASAADAGGTVSTDIDPGKLNVTTTIDFPDRKYQATMTKDGLEIKSYTTVTVTGEITKQRAHGYAYADDGTKITPDKGVKAGDHVTIQKGDAKK